MICAEKKELQDHCTAACNELEAATQQLRSATGVWIDWRTKSFHRDWPKTGRIEKTSEFARQAEALRKYQTASSALSRHLSTHRC
jgi:hypothetical protein